MEGRVLAGRFRLNKMLGQGGMGSVWRAQHLELGTDVAVKLMDPSLATNAEGLARFRREAQAAAALKSPNVVQVFDYGVDDGTPFIAMEMLQGESLASRIERLGRLSPVVTAAVLGQVARALGKAHEAGIVHRDLKPENIFLVQDEELEIAKVLDFGIAKRTGADSLMSGAVQTQTGAMLGTPYYMSPEQAAGKKDVDHRTDIWSFGVIACECLTGRRAFDSETLGGLILVICTETILNPSQLGPVPPQFDAWFARCVARDKQARFQTIREAAAALEAVCRNALIDTQTRQGDVALASTTPAEWQLPRGGLSTSTQTGPTTVTVNRVRNPNQQRLLVLGLLAGLLLIGGIAYLALPKTTPITAVAGSSINLAAQNAVPSNLPIPSAVQSPPSAATPEIKASPVVSTTPISKPVQNKPEQNKSVLRPATTPAAAAKPSAARTDQSARPTARPHPVDLAF